MPPDTFKKLAGPDARLDAAETGGRWRPRSRGPGQARPEAPGPRGLLSTTSFDMIDEPHREAGEELAHWLAANYQPGKPLHVTVVCTGNSRRSFLGATTATSPRPTTGCPRSGSTAAGRPPRRSTADVAAPEGDRRRGRAHGQGGPAGRAEDRKPVYRSPGARRFETPNSRSTTGHEPTPRRASRPCMVCSEADEGARSSRGRRSRVSMPYLDPKIYDGGAYESAKYAERRDDIGRLIALGNGPSTGRAGLEGVGETISTSCRRHRAVIVPDPTSSCVGSPKNSCASVRQNRSVFSSSAGANSSPLTPSSRAPSSASLPPVPGRNRVPPSSRVCRTAGRAALVGR